MANILGRKVLIALAATAAASIASPAFAGQCPANRAGTNPLAGAPTAPVKVTDDLINSVDLGTELKFDGHDLRMRKLVVQPGGIVPLHSHAGRPALILTASGSITEYRSNCLDPIQHKAGDVAREADGISHWWKNNGKVAAILYSADVKSK